MRLCSVCFNSVTWFFLDVLPMLANYNPCDNQDQNFAEKYLNIFAWDFASSHSFQMPNIAYPRPLYCIYSYSWKNPLYHCREIENRRKRKCQTRDA